MCCSFCPNFMVLWLYILAIQGFGILVRFVLFSDYLQCFACKEMDACKPAFDYIVVGSGSAGSIVTRRLLEDKNIKVLLIEAGSEGSSLFDIPPLGVMIQNTACDWKYRTVPQKNACLGLKKKVSHWPMGKVFGGTSKLNNMIYVRGHPSDFERWYKDKKEYSYEVDILPYFQKLENSARIEDVPFISNLSDHILQSAGCANYQITEDILNAEFGFGTIKATVHKGRRWSPANLLKKTNNHNLVIITNTFVDKIFLKNDFEAYGISYTLMGEQLYAKASRGVILAAGVIGTPKILMLSGIGPKDHLRKMRIPPKIDLPVGDNLQDHVTTGFDLILLDEKINFGIREMLSWSSAFAYYLKGRGPWTSVGCENIAFFPDESNTFPEIQLMVLPIGVTSDSGTHLKCLVGINKKSWDGYFAKVNRTAFTILPIVLHPESRGTVRLKNKNPDTPPLINPKYLSVQQDVEVMIKGIEYIKNLVETEPMKKLGASLNTNIFPGCEKFKFDTKPYWECYIRHLTLTSYHPVGTCKMGDVVDFEFRVKGTSKLYVVDGSILPDLPSGNPAASIMMMAEKAADVIKYYRFLSEKKTRLREVLVKKNFC